MTALTTLALTVQSVWIRRMTTSAIVLQISLVRRVLLIRAIVTTTRVRMVVAAHLPTTPRITSASAVQAIQGPGVGRSDCVRRTSAPTEVRVSLWEQDSGGVTVLRASLGTGVSCPLTGVATVSATMEASA